MKHIKKVSRRVPAKAAAFGFNPTKINRGFWGMEDVMHAIGHRLEGHLWDFPLLPSDFEGTDDFGNTPF